MSLELWPGVGQTPQRADALTITAWTTAVAHVYISRIEAVHRDSLWFMSTEL